MRTDHVYLCHILDSIAKIESYATVGKDETKNWIAYAGGCRICAKCNDNVYTKGYA
jgi:hypothetical protein